MTIAPQALGNLLAGCVILLCLVVYFYFKCYRYDINKKTLGALEREIVVHQQEFGELRSSIKAASQEQDQLAQSVAALTTEEEKLKERTRNARLLSDKQLELENEKAKAKYQAQLDEECQALKDSHELTRLQQILGNLNAEISQARRTLSAHQQEVQAAAEEEDYNGEHSLDLTPPEQADITLLREFGPRLAHRDAVNKLIWTEYYQRPLQNLRKKLDADKKTGIYMIKEKATGKMYIGQAVNIGDRWTEHVKAALGIGSTSYQTNKFYKVMHDKGPESFTFAVLELCEAKELSAREKHWIEFYNAVSFGFNTKAGG